jgi:hypothetical protein
VFPVSLHNVALCHYLQSSGQPCPLFIIALCHYISPVFRCRQISSARASHPPSITTLYHTSSIHMFPLLQLQSLPPSLQYAALCHYLQYSGEPCPLFITALCHYLQYSGVLASPVPESPTLPPSLLHATIFRFRRTQSSLHHFSLTQSPVFRSAHSPSITALSLYLQYSGVPILPLSLLSPTFLNPGSPIFPP